MWMTLHYIFICRGSALALRKIFTSEPQKSKGTNTNTKVELTLKQILKLLCVSRVCKFSAVCLPVHHIKN